MQKNHLELNDNDIIKKKGRKKKDLIDMRSNISSLLPTDNALTQRGIVYLLHNTYLPIT